MKVKIFSISNNETLENEVNKFIESVDVVDIKFSSTESWNDVMVLYNDKAGEYKVAGDEQWDREEVWQAISNLSDIRSGYSCLDSCGRPKYHACSLGIKALRQVIGE